MRSLAVIVASLTVLVLCPLPVSAAPARSVAACGGLSASFRVVYGSAGAGNIVYRLRIVNRSHQACSFHVTTLKLLDAKKRALPTRFSFAERRGTSHRLAPGHAAAATARFSPDVPGVGEGNRRRCEPVAHYLALWLGAKRLLVAISPPTSVCEHGALAFTAFK